MSTQIAWLDVSEKSLGAKMHLISPENFVRIWTQSDSVKEATDELSHLCGKKLSTHTVTSRASAYRSLGIVLKHMNQPLKPELKLDVKRLNRLAAIVT